MTNIEKESAVKVAMRELARAFIARDVATVASLLDDDFTGCDSAGVIVSREQWLEDLGSGELTFHAIDAGAIEMTPLDDAVRVRADLTFRAHYSRSNYNGSYRCTGLFAQRDGAWKLLLSSARVAQP